jgi:hypothetical protein
MKAYLQGAAIAALRVRWQWPRCSASCRLRSVCGYTAGASRWRCRSCSFRRFVVDLSLCGSPQAARVVAVFDLEILYLGERSALPGSGRADALAARSSGGEAWLALPFSSAAGSLVASQWCLPLSDRRGSTESRGAAVTTRGCSGACARRLSRKPLGQTK